MKKWDKKILAGVAGVSAAAVVGGLLAFAPVVKKLKVLGTECRSFESQVAEAHALMNNLGGAEGEDRILLKEEDLTLAINEITRTGKSVGVHFSGFSPQEIKKEGESSEYRVLPIEIQIESTFQALGEFLGALDRIGESMVRVASLSTGPASEDATELKTLMTIYLYLAP